VQEIIGQGLPITGGALAGYAPGGYPAPPSSPFSNPSATGNVSGGVIINYAPTLTTTSAYELGQALTPIILDVLNSHGR
jgi:hypothetical protein